MRYIILYKRNGKYDDVIGCSRSKEIAEYICNNDPRCYYVENVEHIAINTPNIDHIYAEKIQMLFKDGSIDSFLVESKES